MEEEIRKIRDAVSTWQKELNQSAEAEPDVQRVFEKLELAAAELECNIAKFTLVMNASASEGAKLLGLIYKNLESFSSIKNLSHCGAALATEWRKAGSNIYEAALECLGYFMECIVRNSKPEPNRVGVILEACHLIHGSDTLPRTAAQAATRLLDSQTALIKDAAEETQNSLASDEEDEEDKLQLESWAKILRILSMVLIKLKRRILFQTENSIEIEWIDQLTVLVADISSIVDTVALQSIYCYEEPSADGDLLLILEWTKKVRQLVLALDWAKAHWEWFNTAENQLKAVVEQLQ